MRDVRRLEIIESRNLFRKKSQRDTLPPCMVNYQSIDKKLIVSPAARQVLSRRSDFRAVVLLWVHSLAGSDRTPPCSPIHHSSAETARLSGSAIHRNAAGGNGNISVPVRHLTPSEANILVLHASHPAHWRRTLLLFGLFALRSDTQQC
jgi:hypothetical protein